MREDRFGDRVVVDKGALCAGGGTPDVDAFMVIVEEGRVEDCAVLHFSWYYLPIRASWEMPDQFLTGANNFEDHFNRCYWQGESVINCIRN